MAREDIYTPVEVKNFDVVGVVDRIDRVTYEMATSESATLNEFMPDDIIRFMRMWNDVNQYITTIDGLARCDLPHSFPAMYSFGYVSKEADVDFESVKNAFIRDLCRLTTNAMIQWSRSESADASNKFLPADKDRWDRMFARGNTMIEQYIEVVKPGDHPESSNYELKTRGIEGGPI